MAIDGVEGLQEGLLAQGGHRFDAQQQFFPFVAQHRQPFGQFGQAGFQLLQFFEGQHVDGFEGLQAQSQGPEFGLQGLQSRLTQLGGNLRRRLGQLPGHLLEPQALGPLCLAQGLLLFG